MKRFSILCTFCLMIAVASFAQGRGQGQGRGPAGGPPSINSGKSIEHANPNRGSDHGPQTSEHSSQNDVATRLSENTRLAGKLQTLFPPETNLQAMAADFRSLGQFVAAAHVSKNLNIPFDLLKTEMVTNKKSLGEAIHQLKPEVEETTITVEVKKAENQAKEDMKN